MFEGFELENVDTGEVTFRVRHGGSGPPLVLLHGHPRTHTTWYDVAPRLADAFTVVCPDLPGYGQSSKPETAEDHSAHSKRAMARHIVALMRHLGHERFAVAGHDRGSYVAHRLAMDHPEAVTRLVVLDGVPIGEALARADATFARKWWHWFFFGQLAKPAERVINADPDAWYGGDPEAMGAENHADFLRAIHDPETVHAMLEDYRAGLGPDREADDADKAAGRKLGCPVLMLWSSRDDMAELYGDPIAVWREWADDVRGLAIESGHHMAEDNPADLAAALREFLG
ncbi:alpha/beta hydrolase fold protein [Amycolatopsis japonica]|uniref:Alpha/beta hydrolase fold protein n=1 Tax=Amycolatopsis japonica TaxID=208439 RepID=A0A075V9S1_9PSEU|nr:alpha/beta hydrolase [Amycolatopsis japonica]AIG81076.1 alpha/beta hydrolase fold protein [Amycolatopsis japonica]